MAGRDLQEKISEHFSIADVVRSEIATSSGIDNSIFGDRLDAARMLARDCLDKIVDKFGPVQINSFYRCEELDAAIRGPKVYAAWRRGEWKSRSQHARGEAADIEAPGVPNAALAHWISANLTYDQLILEYHDAAKPASGWVHISLVAVGNRGQRLIKQRGQPYRSAEKFA